MSYDNFYTEDREIYNNTIKAGGYAICMGAEKLDSI